jgi:hypothetical protein
LLLVQLEAPFYGELKKDIGASMTSSHTWLKTISYIGSSHSIIHTICLVQNLSFLVQQQQGRFRLQDGLLGVNEWGDTVATGIQIEMDQVLLINILQALVSMCYDAMMSIILPLEDQLLSGFTRIKSFVQYPDHHISWALTFTVHNIATPLFDVQGSNHFTFLANAT